MRKLFRSVSAAGATCALLLLLLLPLPGGTCSAQPRTITILHTNDMHAAFLPHEAFWVRAEPKPMVGGVEELAWMIDSVRKAGPGGTLLLDAGDVMTGTPISDYEYKGASGGALFAMMNLIGYDAWTIGNHDLDISQANLRKLTALAAFPTVSANLTDSLGRFIFGNTPSIILERGGLRIGIIGLTTRDLFRVTNTNNLRGLKVRAPWEIAQRLIDDLDPKTDLLIALTHEGVEDDSILAQSVHGLDVIIGGHSHTRLNRPKIVNKVLICQAGSSCENLGELKLTVDGDSVTAFEGKLLPLWTRHSAAPPVIPELAGLVAEFRKKIDDEYSPVLGTLSGDWKRSSSAESSIGEFVADAMREGTGARVGVTNSSGIRKDLSAGPIRRLDLFELAPFHNMLCTFTMSGRELRAFAERFVRNLAAGRASVQISGLTGTWKTGGARSPGTSAAGGGEAAGGGVDKGMPVVLVTLKAGGVEVADDSTYTIGTSDFVVNQGANYIGVVPRNVVYTETTMFQALSEKVGREKAIRADVENHFQRISE